MKKLLVAAALALFATQASAAIANGPHDLSSDNTIMNNYPGGQISSCQFCHAPHNANTGIAGAPLWNRTDVVDPYLAGDLYTSNTLNAASITLGANSITCLSCHDGATDMGATFTGSPGFAAPTLMNTNFQTGGVVAVGSKAASNGLRDDHPVGVPMVTVGGFVDVATAEGYGVVFYGATDNVECGSCHDPHGDADGASGGTSFLRATTVGLCAACHDK